MEPVNARKITYAAVIAVPLLYFMFSLLFVYVQNLSFSDVKFPILIFIIAMIVTISLSIHYIFPIWKSKPEDIAIEMRVVLVRLAIYQIITSLAFFYLIYSVVSFE